MSNVKVNVPAKSFLKVVPLGTLYWVGKFICWNISGVVDKPPFECVTVTPTLPIVPVAVLAVTLLHVDQYKPWLAHNEFWMVNCATVLIVPVTATLRVVAPWEATVILPDGVPAFAVDTKRT